MTKQTNLYTLDFSKFTPEALSGLFQEYKKLVLKETDELIAKGDNLTAEDLFGEKKYDYDLYQEQNLSPMFHLSSVADSPEYREQINNIIPEATALSLAVMQNKDLYNVLEKFHQSDKFAKLSDEEKVAFEKTLTAYRNNGISLEGEKQKQFAKLSEELSLLTTRYSNNCLDAQQAWSKLITNKEDLAGVPETTLELLQHFAQQRGYEEGYLVTLDPPSMVPVLQYCANRELRREVFYAYGLLASEYTDDGKYNNSELVEEIYQKLQQQARLLGYKNYTELSLSTKMAESSEQVLAFLNDLADRSLDKATELYNTIRKFAEEKDGITDFKPYDAAYYRSMYGKEAYALDPEEVRKYFPADKVLEGLFAIVEKLYGLKFEVDDSVTTYNPDVKFLRGYENGELVAGCYVDMYARTGKRAGAWMGQAFGRCETETRVKLPVAYICANFNPPVNGRQAQLTFEEVTTLFHEMGHALHLLLTKTKVQDVCGTNVEWDAVELPSQINENWCYELEALKLLTRHVDTGETMPEELVEKIRAHKEFERSPLFLARQLEFGLFDMELFAKDDSDTRSVREVYLDVYNRLTKVINGGFESKGTFPNVFQHIFAGGYTAGYYSYLWADVLASDAFAAYVEKGNIFDQEVATAFKENILAKGGTRPSMESYEAFRGRKPNNDALLRSFGLLK